MSDVHYVVQFRWLNYQYARWNQSGELFTNDKVATIYAKENVQPEQEWRVLQVTSKPIASGRKLKEPANG